MAETISIPGYRIVRKLGQGGMATVYLAVQESLEREVAIKIMSPLLNSDPSFATRFKREARIVAHMNHASIVPVFEVGEHQSHHYLTMEYLPGGDLKRRILRSDRSPTLALSVCNALSGALDLAHRKGFVHRDIKPENILFREDGTPVLTDFGIARALDNGGSLTVAGVLVGTPNYMSPEQVKGLDLDGRSDLYSLGIVFYEILTGEAPFHADSTLSAALKHLSDSMPALPPEYAHFQQFLDCLTSKERDERFASGAEVVRALRLLGSDRALRDRTIMRPVRAGDVATQGVSVSTSAPIAMPAPAIPTPIEEPAAKLVTARRPERVNSVESPGNNVPPPKAAPRKEPSFAERCKTAAIAAKTSLMRMLASLKLTTDGKYRSRIVWVGAVSLSALAVAVALIMSGMNDRSSEAKALPAAAIPAPPPAPVALATPQPEPQVPSAPAEGIADASTPTADVVDPEAAARAAAEAQAAAAARKQQLADERRRRKEEEIHLAELRAAEVHAAELRAQDQQVKELLATAKSEYAAGAIWQPEGANAAEHYRIALRIQPQRAETIAGAGRVANLLAAEAERAESAGNLATSKQLVNQLQLLQPNHPQLGSLEARVQQLEQTPTVLNSRDKSKLEKAGKYTNKAYEYLGRRPLDLRAVAAATDEYDDAVSAAPMAPGLPLLKERIAAAYATAAQNALGDDHDTKRALKVINFARKRNWMSEELAQIEQGITTETAAR